MVSKCVVGRMIENCNRTSSWTDKRLFNFSMEYFAAPGVSGTLTVQHDIPTQRTIFTFVSKDKTFSVDKVLEGYNHLKDLEPLTRICNKLIKTGYDLNIRQYDTRLESLLSAIVAHSRSNKKEIDTFIHALNLLLLTCIQPKSLILDSYSKYKNQLKRYVEEDRKEIDLQPLRKQKEEEKVCKCTDCACKTKDNLEAKGKTVWGQKSVWEVGSIIPKLKDKSKVDLDVNSPTFFDDLRKECEKYNLRLTVAVSPSYVVNVKFTFIHPDSTGTSSYISAKLSEFDYFDKDYVELRNKTKLLFESIVETANH